MFCVGSVAECAMFSRYKSPLPIVLSCVSCLYHRASRNCSLFSLLHGESTPPLPPRKADSSLAFDCCPPRTTRHGLVLELHAVILHLLFLWVARPIFLSRPALAFFAARNSEFLSLAMHLPSLYICGSVCLDAYTRPSLHQSLNSR